MPNLETLKRHGSSAAPIWGFIVQIWCSSRSPASIWSLSTAPSWISTTCSAAQAVGAHRHHRPRHDGHHDQRQHRPQRRRDLVALAAIVMLDSMTWPVLAGLGDWASRWRAFAPLTGVRWARSTADRLEDRRRCLHRHAGRDARLPRPGVHVQRREADYRT
jgi:hypothetical protein